VFVCMCACVPAVLFRVEGRRTRQLEAVDPILYCPVEAEREIAIGKA